MLTITCLLPPSSVSGAERRGNLLLLRGVVLKSRVSGTCHCTSLKAAAYIDEEVKRPEMAPFVLIMSYWHCGFHTEIPLLSNNRNICNSQILTGLSKEKKVLF